MFRIVIDIEASFFHSHVCLIETWFHLHPLAVTIYMTLPYQNAFRFYYVEERHDKFPFLLHFSDFFMRKIYPQPFGNAQR